MAWQSGGGGGGAAPFSGASVQNFNDGQTLVSDLQAGPVFTVARYDTNSYLTGGDHFVVAKTGYYAVLFGFQADGPFVGSWEIAFTMLGTPDSIVAGIGAADQSPNGIVYDEGHIAAGGTVLFNLVQRSGSDQLVFPYARIHFLGS